MRLLKFLFLKSKRYEPSHVIRPPVCHFSNLTLTNQEFEDTAIPFQHEDKDVHMYEYHILYSPVFQVPTLYFNACQLGVVLLPLSPLSQGLLWLIITSFLSYNNNNTSPLSPDGTPLTWEQIWEDLPSCYKDERIRWTFITQKVLIHTK